MRQRIQRMLTAAVGLLLLLSASGCGFSFSPTDLYSLPQLPEEYTELNSSLNQLLESGAEYAAPVSGSNIQPVQLEDLDGDGEEEALAFFDNLPRIRNKIATLVDVGLGYIKLGQSATTLSGGEAQRVKLATELSKRSTGRTIYILDEPTTGLHTDDVKKLLEVLQRLVDAGNTVLVIEHNLDVIKCADYLLDLGPEGGSGGGTLVCEGTPEEICQCETSYTGQYLAPVLQKSRRVETEE